MSASKIFRPQDSKVKKEALADFLSAEIGSDLKTVPNVGPATQRILNGVSITITSPNSDIVLSGITNTYSLIGIFLLFKNSADLDSAGQPVELDPVEHVQRFYSWLQSIGTPAGFRAGIVHSIAQKVDLAFPGIYDVSAYDDAAASADAEGGGREDS